MLIAYLKQAKLQAKIITAANKELLSDALWIDLLMPTEEEERLVEEMLNLNVPTREEMKEIELSNRLYSLDNNLFMTATMIARSDPLRPKYESVTFILTPEQFVTVRYIEPQSFILFIGRLSKIPVNEYNPYCLMIEFLEFASDRLADILESVGHHMDEYSKNLFHPLKAGYQQRGLNYEVLLKTIGFNGDLNTNAQESLASFYRLILFFEYHAEHKINEATKLRLNTIAKDMNAMTTHSGFVSNKINFLLDATFGLVHIQQNNIIKIFSIVAVILLPPTLVASVYGMNFHNIPELSWRYGYPFAILLMVLCAILPYLYFKTRHWL